MKKIGVLLLGLLLLGPSLPLLAVGVLMNPAAMYACGAGSLAVGPIPDSLTATTADGTSVTLDRSQLSNAAVVITTGARTPGVTRNAIIIALMAGLTESRLRMLSNVTAYPESANYPNDGDGSDQDSLGMFQMRPQAGWGTVEQLMAPLYQARAFYGGPTGPNHGSPRGLLDIHNWASLSLGEAAQAVEVSAYPDRYANWQPVAESILTTLTQPVASGGGVESDVPETGSVVFPLPAGTWVKGSGFGWRSDPFPHQPRFHAGTDYSAPDGTPILAVADGVVTFSGPLGRYGNAIIIRHTVQGQDVSSLYGHMWDGDLYVHKGDHVIAGQHIADVGSNGRSTGPHLHFEIRLGGNQPIDSNLWLAQHGATNLDNPDLNAAGCYLGGN